MIFKSQKNTLELLVFLKAELPLLGGVQGWVPETVYPDLL